MVAIAPEITNTELILVAILLAGGDQGYCDVEDIAEAAYRLSPQRFGRRTKPYPSDKIVVQAIADLEGRHKVTYTLRGRAKTATRMLTAEGRKRAVAVAERMAGRAFGDVADVAAFFATSPPKAKADRRRVQADLTDLRKHRAFDAWADTGHLDSVSKSDLLDALTCLPDAPESVVHAQIEQLQAQAEQWDDGDLLEFLGALRRELLSPPGHRQAR